MTYSLGSEADVKAEEGWPFRLAFTSAFLAFFINNAFGSTVSDVFVFVVVLVIVFGALVYWRRRTAARLNLQMRLQTLEDRVDQIESDKPPRVEDVR